MKYSYNPKSGVLEQYTDDGVYMGSVFTIGDAIMADLEANGDGTDEETADEAPENGGDLLDLSAAKRDD